MPMGIVSDKDFDLERSKLDGPDKKESIPTTPPPPITGEVIDVPRGRPNGAVEVPNGLRKLIGEESAIHGRQSALELAQSFGISPSSTSAYNAGATSTSTYGTTPNKPHIDAAKQRVSNRARSRLMNALRHITNEKLESAKPVELSAIARNMSAIVKDMEPDTPKSPNGDGKNSGPTFVFYSPQIRKEDHYDVVRVNE